MGIYIPNLNIPKGAKQIWIDIWDKDLVSSGIFNNYEVQNLDLVRCGECKYAVINRHDRPLCSLVDRTIKREDFCSYGERRADERVVE